MVHACGMLTVLPCVHYLACIPNTTILLKRCDLLILTTKQNFVLKPLIIKQSYLGINCIFPFLIKKMTCNSICKIIIQTLSLPFLSNNLRANLYYSEFHCKPTKSLQDTVSGISVAAAQLTCQYFSCWLLIHKNPWLTLHRHCGCICNILDV